MLRLPPTTIGLGRSDIKDYDKRREHAQQKEKKTSSMIVNKASYVIPNGCTALAYRPVAQHGIKSVAITSPKRMRPSSYINLTPISTWDNKTCSHLGHLGHIRYSRNPAKVSSDDIVVDDFDNCSSAEDSFFITGSAQNLPENYYSDSSSLSISKPRIHIPSYILPPNHPHNGKNSPECCLESCFIPHVVSRVASHNSSGILFSQLPKRKGKLPNRATSFKEYGNSHESSKSSSVTCEHNPDSLNSINDIISSPKKLTMLYEKFPSTPSRRSEDVSAGSISSQIPPQEETVSNQNSMRLTRQFMLPPPFSNLPRRFSATGSLPGTKPSTHPEENFKGTNTSQNSNIPCPKNDAEMQSFILTDHLRAVSQGLSPQISPLQGSLEHLDINDRSQVELIPQTPSRSYRVYNDNLTPMIQPQTPANLPEYRHKSRYHPSFTVSDSQGCPRRCNVTGVIDRFGNLGRHQPNPVVGQSSDYRNRASFDLDIDNFDSDYEGIINGVGE